MPAGFAVGEIKVRLPSRKVNDEKLTKALRNEHFQGGNERTLFRAYISSKNKQSNEARLITSRDDAKKRDIDAKLTKNVDIEMRTFQYPRFL